MPFARHGETRLFWRQDGRLDAPPLLLLHTIGTDHALWDRTAPLLADHCRVIRMDLRGHGASDAPQGDYSLDLLAADAAAVLDAAGVGKAGLCGIGLGGTVALQFALNHPGRISALIAACSTAEIDPDLWRERADRAHNGDMEALADASAEVWISVKDQHALANTIEMLREAVRTTAPEGYAGCAAAMCDMQLMTRLRAIETPTLVIGAAEDRVLPFPDHGAQIHSAIPGALSAILAGGHLLCVQNPAATATTILRFLEDLRDGGAARAARAGVIVAGQQTRRQVLGDAWVDRSLANRDDWIADYQDYAVRVAWDEVWGRPGLDHRTRRLLVLSITASTGRWEEFRLHVRSGLEKGAFTLAEVKEVLIQAGVYAGIPVAHTGFAEVAKLIGEMGEDHPG